MRSHELDIGHLIHPDAVDFDVGVPGVVIVHDVWGLSDHTRDLARRFAEARFAALAVNLYHRVPSAEIRDPGKWMRDLSDPQVLADVSEAVAVLRDHPATRGRGIAVVGFCMGGMYALMAGCEVEGIAAAVAFYGILSHQHGLLHSPEGLDPARKPREPLSMASELRCPLLAFFGGADPYVPLDDVRALEDGLSRAAAASEVVIYPDAGHAFMNDTRPDAFRPKEAKEAWDRTVAFLRACCESRDT